jgi:hypothetical protein
MKHRLTPQQYLILLTVTLTAAVGDTLLSHGMAQVGTVDIHHLGLLFHAMLNPWVDCGVILLIGFFASYLTALSWADLTFVLPSTAFSYVDVGFISQGPALTEHPAPETIPLPERVQEVHPA